MCRRMNLVRVILFLSALCGGSVAQAQFFFEADAVFLNRNNSGDAPFISGPNAVSTGDGSYGVEPGYRLGFGWIGDDLQIDATFTQLSPWTADTSGGFANNLSFGEAPGVMPPNNSLTFPGFLNQATVSTLGTVGPGNEIGLGPNSTFTSSSRSNYRDFELNVRSSPYKRPWSLGVGYRNISLDEENLFSLNGTFTTSGAGAAGGLTEGALTAAGASFVSGSFDGYQMTTPPTFLNYQVNGNARNELNGAQAIFGYRIFDNSWFTLEGCGKAGIYANNVSGNVVETVAGSGNDNSVYQRNLSANDLGAAFAGNLGLKAIFGITDYIDLIVGYEILFLSGVGLGADQLNGVSRDATGTAVYKVQHDGSLIANGGTIGLRIYW